MLTQHDKELIAKARRMRWEDINEDEAETQEGWQELHDIAVSKYHDDEFLAGML